MVNYLRDTQEQTKENTVSLNELLYNWNMLPAFIKVAPNTNSFKNYIVNYVTFL